MNFYILQIMLLKWVSFMNKFLDIIKNILIIVNVILISYLIIFTNCISTELIIYIILLLYLCFICYKDYKNKVILSNRYNMLFNVIEIFILFLLFRAIFDSNIVTNIYNSSYYNSNALFFIQNIPYIIILYISLIIYHKIEVKNKNYLESKYSEISVICFLINIILIIPTMQFFTETYSIMFNLLFLIIELILITIEIYSLIKYNGKKREWIIYFCFLCNMFAILSIIF